MNILPHKSWHVRTKKNIARVRKDEAQAAEEEKERQRKISLAAQEARTAVLRERAGVRLISAAASAPIDPETEVSLSLAPVTDIIQKDGHVNFFQDVEEGKRQGGVNDDAESDKKKEQEDYEKKIGYLVYLGQDSLEASKKKPWYANIDRSKGPAPEQDVEVEKIKQFEKSGYLDHLTKDCKLTPEELKLAKFRSFQDPLKDIRRYLKTPGITQKLNESESGALKRKSTSDLPIPHLSSTAEPKSKKSKKEKKKKSKKSKSKKSHKHNHRNKKHSKHKRSRSRSSSTSSGSEEDSEDERKRQNIEKLRTERLEREREEKRKTDRLLAKLRGEKDPEEVEKKLEEEKNSSQRSKGVKQRYNAQFNPQFARQNYDFRK